MDAPHLPGRSMGVEGSGAVADEDVIEPFRSWVWGFRVHEDVLPAEQALLLFLGPPPRVQRAVARRPIFGDIILRVGNGAASFPFGRVIRGTQGGLRMQRSPCILDRRVGCDQLVRKR